jgi:hypothetical protein
MLKKSFSRLTNEAFATLASETVQIVKDTNDDTLTGHPLFKTITPAYDLFFPVLDKSTFSGMGEEIAALDKRRDNVYSALHGIVKGWSKVKDEELPAGSIAAGLLALFKDVERARKMSNRTYAQETSAIEHLVSLMEEEKTKANFNKLGVSDLCSWLKVLNITFKTNYLEQVKANAGIRQQGTATDKRKELEIAMRNFYALVDSMKNIAPWSTLYPKLEELQLRTKN